MRTKTPMTATDKVPKAEKFTLLVPHYYQHFEVT
jgi:hypothetical protein